MKTILFVLTLVISNVVFADQCVSSNREVNVFDNSAAEKHIGTVGMFTYRVVKSTDQMVLLGVYAPSYSSDRIAIGWVNRSDVFEMKDCGTVPSEYKQAK